MRDGTTFQREKAGLYVHIPFCVQKCIYCDFNSVPDCSRWLQSEYFEGLKREIGQFGSRFAGRNLFAGLFPMTVLIGFSPIHFFSAAVLLLP